MSDTMGPRGQGSGAERGSWTGCPDTSVIAEIHLQQVGMTRAHRSARRWDWTRAEPSVGAPYSWAPGSTLPPSGGEAR